MNAGNLSFFPPWAESETLYSVCARFHQRSGFRLPCDTSVRLFGFPTASRYRQLPLGLAHFFYALSTDFPDATHILRERTIAPFYLALLDQTSQLEFFGIRNNPPGSTAFARFGVPGNLGITHHPLKYCAECIRNDHSTLGFSYWHIEHQYPGVWLCERHVQVLKSHHIDRSMFDAWITSPSPDQIPLDSGKQPDPWLLDTLRRLSYCISWMASQSSLTTLTLQTMIFHKLEAAAGSSDRKVICERLTREIQNLISRLLLAIDSPELRELGRLSWISSVFKPSYLHPLQLALPLSILYTSTELDCYLLNNQSQPDSYDLFGGGGHQHQEPVHERFQHTLMNGLNIQTSSTDLQISKSNLQALIETSPRYACWWKTARREYRRRLYRNFVISYVTSHPGISLREMQAAFPEKIRWIQANDNDWLLSFSRRGFRIPIQLELD